MTKDSSCAPAPDCTDDPMMISPVSTVARSVYLKDMLGFRFEVVNT